MTHYRIVKLEEHKFLAEYKRFIFWRSCYYTEVDDYFDYHKTPDTYFSEITALAAINRFKESKKESEIIKQWEE